MEETILSATQRVGEATPEVITGWKKDYNVKEMVIQNGEEISVCYVRKPNRIHIARAMSLVLENKPIEAGESLLDDCWLGGDERCKSIEDKDTEYRVSAAWCLYNKTNILNAEIKNV